MQANFINTTAIVIPAYCPDKRLPPYVQSLKEAGFGKIIVIDDGSGSAYSSIFDSIVPDEQVVYLTYMPNAGKGVALKKGLTYLQTQCLDMKYFITADSDGQHTVADILRMAEALQRHDSCLLLGTRDFSKPDVPPKSRMGNRITTCVFRGLYGQWVSDTQTGLRGFDRSLLATMIDIEGDRYEYEMNVLVKCATLRIPIEPLTIETVYENNNEGSHFRAFRDSARIYSIIFKGFFRFTSTSIISFGCDYALFLLLNTILKQHNALAFDYNFYFFTIIARILVATGVARIISGVINYSLNRKYVFNNHAAIRTSLPRYLLVFFLTILCSAGLTNMAHTLFGWSDNIAKIPADILLFCCNYYIQQNWVFSTRKNNKKA